MVNPFSATGFDLIGMTAAINKVPDSQRLIGHTEKLGIFRPVPITTTTFGVEEYNGVLNLLVSQPRGAPALKNTTGKRKMRNFSVPHYPLDDVILPAEIQNVRAFGDENAAETAASIMARKLAQMRMKHDLTREWLRFKCLEGILVDGDATSLVNYFTEFGISQEIVDWDLDDAATDVNAKCRALIDFIETNLKGDTMTGVHCYCSPEFYDLLVGHPNVEKAFTYFSTTQQLSADYRAGFNFAGVTFTRITSTTTDPAGVSRKMVDANYAQAFPVGTVTTFQEVISPGDFMETANTMGIPYYAKQMEMEFNRGTKIHTQMNVLPICTRPEVLVKVGMNIT